MTPANPKRFEVMVENCDRARGAFTLLELAVILVMLPLLVSVLVPALARSHPTSKTFQCQNNLRQLYSGWRQWADDNADYVVAAENVYANSALRPTWVSGNVDFMGTNPANFDTNQNLAKSPLWVYVARNPVVFKCPADPSTVTLGNPWNGLPVGTIVPRVRSVSMNSAFGQGTWLDSNFNQSQTVWRTYAKVGEVVMPAQTFLFADEHGGSINDGVLNTACTGANSPLTARIIDVPASYHDGSANFSFVDGHALAHQWIGPTIRPAFQQGTFVNLNTLAADSWLDVQWLAQNTTVRR